MSSRIPKLGGGKRGRQQVFLLNPTDKRGIALDIEKETDLGLVSKKTDDQVYRIWKHGNGWSFKNGTIFLAIEGQPVTSYLTEMKEKKFTKLKSFLIWSWGKNGQQLYDAMPPEMREPLEGKYHAEVTVLPAKLEEGAKHILTKIRAGEILKDQSIEMLNDLGKSVEKKDAVKDIVATLINICLGAFGLYFLEHALQWF